MNNDLLSLINKVFRKDRLTINLNTSLEEKLNEVYTYIIDIYNNNFVDTAIWGLDIFEKEIKSSYIFQTLDNRRSSIMAKWRGVGVLTLELMQTTLGAYLNADVDIKFIDGVILVIFVSTYGIPNNIELIYNVVEDIKPAHLPVEYIFKYRLWETLNSYFWEEFSDITWNDLRESDLSEKLPLYTIWETLNSYFWGELFNIEWNDLKESDLSETNK